MSSVAVAGWKGDALELLSAEVGARFDNASTPPSPTAVLLENEVKYSRPPFLGEAKGLSGRLCSKLHLSPQGTKSKRKIKIQRIII